MVFDVENHGQKVLVSVPTIFVFFATVALAARFYSRKASRIAPGADDYLAAFALVCVYGLWITLLINVLQGGGGSTGKVSPQAVVIFLKTTGAKFELWATSVAVIQLAILAFYLRLFKVRVWFKYTCYATIGLVVAWWISTFVAELLGCIPLSKIWTPSAPGSCFDEPKFCSATGLIHVVFDFWILGIPIPIIWQLQRSGKSRVLLTGLFAIGTFASICSILRLACLVEFGAPGGSKLAGYLPEMFETIEPAIGIICICVPSMTPIVSIIKRSKIASSVRKLLSTSRATGEASPYTSGGASDQALDQDRDTRKQSTSTGGKGSASVRNGSQVPVTEEKEAKATMP